VRNLSYGINILYYFYLKKENKIKINIKYNTITAVHVPKDKELRGTG